MLYEKLLKGGSYSTLAEAPLEGYVIREGGGCIEDNEETQQLPTERADDDMKNAERDTRKRKQDKIRRENSLRIAKMVKEYAVRGDSSGQRQEES